MRPAVGPQEFAWRGQVRHARPAADLSPRHAGQGAVRLPERHRSHGCVRVQNALQFACSSRRAGRSPRTSSRKRWRAATRITSSSSAKSPCGCSITPHIWTVLSPVPARRLRLGRQCRRGAWTRRAAQPRQKFSERERRRPVDARRAPDRPAPSSPTLPRGC